MVNPLIIPNTPLELNHMIINSNKNKSILKFKIGNSSKSKKSKKKYEKK
jgi:hypothetical protein